jgi:hypothetical protein
LDSDMYNVDCKGDILVHVRFIWTSGLRLKKY